MAVLKRQELREQLQRRQIAPIYVLFGAETYLRDIAARWIPNLCFSKDDLRDFNESEFSLNAEGGLQRAFAAANQLPMMAQRRVIRISDVRVSATGFRDTILEEHEPVLTEYFKSPSPSSVVIFVADELNGVRKMGKLLRSQTTAVEFSPLDDDAATQWASDKFKEAKAEIDGAALRRFVGLVGNDAARIANEAEKLATAALPETTITTSLIESLVPDSREMTNYVLTDNLVSKNRRGTISALKKVLDDGAEPLMILGLISYNFRRLLIAKDMMSRGAERREVIGALNLRGRDQESFLAAARRAELKDLGYSLKRIAEADHAIKMSVGGSGPSGARLQLEVLVAELATL